MLVCGGGVAILTCVPRFRGIRRREYASNRDEVIGMLMQVILNIENPYATVA